MINQHRGLQADLFLVLTNSKSKTDKKGKEILLNLKKFKNDLSAHLKLENGVFYPDYLNKMIRRGDNTTDTKKFIKEMDRIAKKIGKFLERYSSPESIDAPKSNFKNDLPIIIDTLNTRIESEEEGVYDIYLTI